MKIAQYRLFMLRSRMAVFALDLSVFIRFQNRLGIAEIYRGLYLNFQDFSKKVRLLAEFGQEVVLNGENAKKKRQNSVFCITPVWAVMHLQINPTGFGETNMVALPPRNGLDIRRMCVVIFSKKLNW